MVSYRLKEFIQAYGFRGLESVGAVWRQQAACMGAEGASKLTSQTVSQKQRQQEVAGVLTFSKSTSSDILLPNSATNWGLRDQMSDTTEDISFKPPKPSSSSLRSVPPQEAAKPPSLSINSTTASQVFSSTICCFLSFSKRWLVSHCFGWVDRESF